ncbi:HTH-type transcriptional regulator PrtR [compost metagenome]
MNTLAERIKSAMSQSGKTQADLVRATGAKAPSVSNWLSGRTKNLKGNNLVAAAALLGVNTEWLADGVGPQYPTLSGAKVKAVLHEDDTTEEVGLIPYWEARGSCGGGFLNYDQLPMGHLVKEASFFKKYGLRPQDAIAVYADGESQADFIVDGDIVIFDTSKTTPRSGKLYLIDHPDGLRIKQLRRDIDGSWILGSRNPDKHKFPDERVQPDQLDLLKIHGEFVYRQGG